MGTGRWFRGKEGFGFWVSGSGFGFRVSCFGFRVRVSGFGFRVSSLGFRVQGFAMQGLLDRGPRPRDFHRRFADHERAPQHLAQGVGLSCSRSEARTDAKMAAVCPPRRSFG